MVDVLTLGIDVADIAADVPNVDFREAQSLANHISSQLRHTRLPYTARPWGPTACNLHRPGAPRQYALALDRDANAPPIGSEARWDETYRALEAIRLITQDGAGSSASDGRVQPTEDRGVRFIVLREGPVVARIAVDPPTIEAFDYVQRVVLCNPPLRSVLLVLHAWADAQSLVTNSDIIEGRQLDVSRGVAKDPLLVTLSSLQCFTPLGLYLWAVRALRRRRLVDQHPWGFEPSEEVDGICTVGTWLWTLWVELSQSIDADGSSAIDVTYNNEPFTPAVAPRQTAFVRDVAGETCRLIDDGARLSDLLVRERKKATSDALHAIRAARRCKECGYRVTVAPSHASGRDAFCDLHIAPSREGAALNDTGECPACGTYYAYLKGKTLTKLCAQCAD